MKLRNLVLLFTVLILMACNESDSTSKTQSADNTNSDNIQSESSTNDNTSAVETEPEREGKVVARVNGQAIYEDDLGGGNLEFAISEEIIYQEGLRQGIDKKYRNKVRDFEKSLIIRDIKQSLLENAEPTKKASHEEIKDYYEKNKDKYSHVRVYEISFPDSNLGNEILEKAKGGEDLQNIANSYPDMVINVNDIGYNRSMLQHFKTREVGVVSEVIQKPDGTFSVLKIVEVKDIPFNSSKQAIMHILKAKKKSRMFNNYSQKIANENNMTIEIIK